MKKLMACPLLSHLPHPYVMIAADFLRLVAWQSHLPHPYVIDGFAKCWLTIHCEVFGSCLMTHAMTSNDSEVPSLPCGLMAP